MDAADIKVYGYRWVVLAVFMLINVTMQILWICFAPVTGLAASFYHVTDLDIGLLAITFMIVFIPVAIPASWAIDTLGFKRAVGLGAILMAVFGLLRGLVTTSYTATLLFTIGIAVGQPFLLNAWTKVAAVWFPLKERATAVGLAGVATFVGIIIGEALTPVLVLQFGFQGMQLIYGLAAVVTAAAFLALARTNPPTPASPPGYEARALVLDGLKQILRQRDFYFLAFGLFIGNGVFNGVATWVETFVRPRGFTINDAGSLGAVMLVGGVIGAAALPALSDRLRVRKLIIIVGFALSIPGMIGMAFGFNIGVLLASFFVIGLFTSGIGPVAYQYGAEITQPAPEGTSNGLFWLAGQLSFVLVSAMGWSNDQFKSFVPSIVVLIGLVVLTCILLAVLKESPMMRRAATAGSGS